jgi:hypothetical protein
MAVIQISRIQHRRGLEADLPNLSSAELGWSVDTRKLYIGNGTIEEGAPSLGKTEILTQYSILDFETSFAGNVTTLQGNVTVLEGNIVTLTSQVAAITAQSTSTTVTLPSTSTGTVTAIAANNAIVTYTLKQGTKVRTGTLVLSHDNSTPSYVEDYTETASTDLVFSVTSNVTHANVNYSTTSSTTLSYQVKTI